MPESPRRVDLRLTIPADAPYMAVAIELASKFAEYSGAAAGAAQNLARAVEAALAPVAAASPRAAIDLEMSAQGTELVVTATSGSITNRATCPLPD